MLLLFDTKSDSCISTFTSDPAYVVAPVLKSRSAREDLKKLFAGTKFELKNQ